MNAETKSTKWAVTGVHLITGLIGSGKTLRAVTLIDADVKAGRAVYACNVNGLNIPGVIPFDDPKQWQDLPPGALLVVDEAQRFWRARRTAEVPLELQGMETSRHDAVSFLIITQQPTYLDKHLRGLVTKHEHLFRRMGAQAAELLTWERCHDEPMSPGSREGAESTMFIYPKENYGKYKSSEQHTVKFKLGWRMKLVGVALTLVLGSVGWLVYSISNKVDETKVVPPTASAGASPKAKAGTPAAAVLSRDEYFEKLKPRAEQAPWSAPIFDGQKAVSKPASYCMKGGEGYDAQEEYKPATCTCLTEQGTPYVMSLEVCEAFARNGPAYNPFKAPERSQERQSRSGVGQRPTVTARGASAPLGEGIGSEDGQQARYGQFRSQPIPDDPAFEGGLIMGACAAG